jgi:hypothetical protein
MLPFPVPFCPNEIVSQELSEAAVRAQFDADACTWNWPTVSGVAGALIEAGVIVNVH